MSDLGWYERMAQRAAARASANDDEPRFNRDNWPVPPEVQRGASARDAFLWYIYDGWQKIFGDDQPIENLMDHDFGYHVLRKGQWQLTLVNLEWFPSDRFDADADSEKEA